jgi:16S rRNA (guanine527-N7)-methyltransferase
MSAVEPAEPLPAAATALFGERLPLAVRYAELLRGTGTSHGLIGPREGERLWERHLLNCAVLAELIEPGARVLDLGSGAGLPGIPLAIARPDLEIALLEPMARRVTWLQDALADLGLPLIVERGRAEEKDVRREWADADVVTARAVAPLGKLGRWALPLLRPGGRLLAMKGESAAEEARRDEIELRRFGGAPPRVVQCGQAYVDPPTTVVVVERSATGAARRRPRAGDGAGGRAPRQRQETGGGRSDDVHGTGSRRGRRG